MIRVLIAEDSVTVRQFLREILDSDPEITVIGLACNGAEAVEMTARLQPDVVVMDIQMPVMDGFEATRAIMTDAPTPIVIVSATVDIRQVEVSMHALRAGALGLLDKPRGRGSPNHLEERKQLIWTVKAMSQVKVVRLWQHRRSPQMIAAAKPSANCRLVAIAASTGGPAALQQIFSQLPPDFSAPVLVVQHMGAGFIEGLASWLNATCRLRARVAEDHLQLEPGHVYLAPDERHLGVARDGHIALSDAAPIGGFRPSGNYLFRSAAEAFGANTVGVVLTGMGEDGVEGLRQLRSQGGTVVAQDEVTSIVFGMPRAAIAAGIVNVIAPLPDIAAHLVALTGAGASMK